MGALAPEPPQLPEKPGAAVRSLQAVNPLGAERDEPGGGHPGCQFVSGYAAWPRRDQRGGAVLPQALGAQVGGQRRHVEAEDGQGKATIGGGPSGHFGARRGG